MTQYQKKLNMTTFCDEQKYSEEYNSTELSDVDIGNQSCSEYDSDNWVISAEKCSEQNLSAPKPIQLVSTNCTCSLYRYQDGQKKPCEQKFWTMEEMEAKEIKKLEEAERKERFEQQGISDSKKVIPLVQLVDLVQIEETTEEVVEPQKEEVVEPQKEEVVEPQKEEVDEPQKENWNNINKRKRLCFSVGTNKPCPHGVNCRFSHDPTIQSVKLTPSYFLPSVESVRTQAFQIFSNKDEMEKKLLRTKLCRSVGTDYPCPHGSRCRFAHSPDELEISTCIFGVHCRNVTRYNGRYYSKNVQQRCDRLHPNETIQNFYIRTGLPAPQPKKNTPNDIEMPTLSEAYGKKDSGPIITKVESQPIVEQEKETVLKVPKELAVQAMELAIKSGKKNIKVEII